MMGVVVFRVIHEVSREPPVAVAVRATSTLRTAERLQRQATNGDAEEIFWQRVEGSPQRPFRLGASVCASACDF